MTDRYTRIYTDAGKKGLPCYGYYSPSTGENAFFLYVVSKIDIAMAELMGIQKALKSKTVADSENIVIYCDNLGVVDFMMGRNEKRWTNQARNKQYWQLMLDSVNVHNELKKTKRIAYAWIDGRLNPADPLLRNAIKLSNIDIEYKLQSPENLEEILQAWKQASPVRLSQVNDDVILGRAKVYE